MYGAHEPAECITERRHQHHHRVQDAKLHKTQHSKREFMKLSPAFTNNSIQNGQFSNFKDSLKGHPFLHTSQCTQETQAYFRRVLVYIAESSLFYNICCILTVAFTQRTHAAFSSPSKWLLFLLFYFEVTHKTQAESAKYDFVKTGDVYSIVV